MPGKNVREKLWSWLRKKEKRHKKRMVGSHLCNVNMVETNIYALPHDGPNPVKNLRLGFEALSSVASVSQPHVTFSPANVMNVIVVLRLGDNAGNVRRGQSGQSGAAPRKPPCMPLMRAVEDSNKTVGFELWMETWLSELGSVAWKGPWFAIKCLAMITPPPLVIGRSPSV